MMQADQSLVPHLEVKTGLKMGVAGQNIQREIHPSRHDAG